MDAIQIIKEKIERIKNENSIGLSEYDSGYCNGVGETCDELLQFIDSLPEEPASEDLEEYAKKLAKGAALDKHNLIWMCKKGAEWQKQQDEELFSKDTWNYIEENYPNITEEEKLRLYDVSIKSRLAGADTFKKYIREEMKKDAVETTIVNDWQYGKDPDHAIIPAIHQRIKGFTVGDKVKIIVIKENKQ
jgi:hypothetical protein